MLRSLTVRNYVLIDSLEIDFPEGLIIITGQTGAGKSIILGALSLLMGAKADASAISGGADSCVVEGEFSIEGSDAIRSLLEENDVEWDDGTLIVRRVVNRSGRSRSFINDSPVNVQVLGSLASSLVDIHSQHQSLELTDRRFQLAAIDFFAGNADLLAECCSACDELRSLEAERTAVATRLSRLAAERDWNEAQYKCLEDASLKEGELEELETEQKKLANAEEIKEALCFVEGSLSAQDDGMQSEDARLKACSHQLSKIAGFVPEAEQLSGRLDSVRLEVQDILADISSINSRLEVSGDRLEQVESRMSAIYGLFKKFSCTSVEELIDLKKKFSDALFDSSSLELRKDELDRKISDASARLDAVSSRLHESRVKACPAFSAAIMDSIHFLELDNALFTADLSEAPVSASGRDSVTFLFSASGQNPVDLAKCASGGELSRIMLSLKALMAKFTDMPTMIFDEIDTGVSGSVADRMGSMICNMGRDMQVFAITHLPQVAAKGDAHYLVTKTTDASGRTVSNISRLDADARIQEVARMLSGAVVTDAAVENAKSLLGY